MKRKIVVDDKDYTYTIGKQFTIIRKDGKRIVSKYNWDVAGISCYEWERLKQKGNPGSVTPKMIANEIKACVV